MTLTAAPPAAKTYAPLDLFDINRLLDEDERDIAATVRQFVDTRLKPTSRNGSNRPPCPASWPRNSAHWACSACTWTDMAAPAPMP